MVMSDKDHFDLFKKPQVILKKSSPEKLDFVKEYFKFEELLKKGFKSRFLSKNPYEGEFYAYVTDLEKQYASLPPSIARMRICEHLEKKVLEAQQCFDDVVW